MENQLKGFYITFEDKDDKLTYLDEGFDKIAANFVRIETLCSRYYTTFPSRSKLHNYLKSDYLEMFLFSLPTQATLSIPIIASKTVHQSFNFGLVFRG